MRSNLHVSFVLLLSLVLTLIVGGTSAFAADLPPGGTFVDDDGNVHEGFIEAIADEDITRGCGPERYCPDRDVTRGEMAAFIRRARSLPRSSTNYFTDDDGHLFERDINALAKAGITAGCGDGTKFCPDARVTRGQMAAFLRRADDLPSPRRDRFVDDGRSPFEDDINAIAVAGITRGCNPPANDRFCPDDRTDRDQMASFLGRFLRLDPTPPPDRDPAELSVEDAILSWFPDMYEGAVRVARCESRLNPRAVNSAGYHGLFQIGSRYHTASFERVTGKSWSSAVYEPYYNAQYARYLYNQSGSWRAWTCKP